MLTSLFKALDAGPAPINFNELYSALQTGVVEGQENPLPIIATAKLYEVQKYDQPDLARVGRVLDSRQPPRVGEAARRHARDRHARIRGGRHAAARGHREAERVAARRT